MNKPGTRLFVTLPLCLVAALLFSANLFSQSSLPPFKMLLSNNKVFSATELPKNKPVIVIYFDPDCDHCQKLAKEIFKNINSFRRIEVVMVTFKPIAEVTAFEKKYKTHNYSNVNVGTEGTTFQLRNYYQLTKMPFAALYDKHQKLNSSYGQEASADVVIKRLKTL